MSNGPPAESPSVFVLEQRFRYEYSVPVRQLRHRLLVVPRLRHGRQRRLGHGHAVDGATCEVTTSTDRNGNRVVCVDAPAVATHVEFVAWSRIAVGPERPTLVSAAALGRRRWTAPTPLTASDEPLRRAARSLVGGDVLEVADRICAWTHEQLTYGFGSTDVRTTAVEALREGRGVCQDYAHVMLAVCRAAGIAVRYVSGHLVGEGGSHAWVEVFAPTAAGGAEAVAFDPTHRRRAGHGYVTVAVGRDYADVPPTSGTFHGECAGRLSAVKSLRVEEPSRRDEVMKRSPSSSAGDRSALRCSA